MAFGLKDLQETQDEHDAPAPAAAAPRADDFAGFDRAEIARPAPAKPAVAAPQAGGLESKLAGLIDVPETSAPAPARPAGRPRMSAANFPQDPSPEPEAATPVHGHGNAEPAMAVMSADGLPSEPMADGEGAAAPAPVDERTLVYTGADNLPEIVAKLLRSANMPLDEANKLSGEWCNTLAQDCFDRITNVDPKKKLLDDALAHRQAREGAASAANGGGLGSILGAMLGSQSKGNGQVRKRQREYDAAKEVADKAIAEKAAAMRERVYDVRNKQATQGRLELGGDIDALARAVRLHNDAFMDAPAAASFKAAVQAVAARDGVSVSEVMENVGQGKASPNLMEEFERVREATLGDATVQEARDHMRKRERDVHDGYRKAMQNVDLMARNFPDRYDSDLAQRELTETLDMLPRSVPTPVTETADDSKMKEGMALLAKQIRESFERLFENLMSAFSPK